MGGYPAGRHPSLEHRAEWRLAHELVGEIPGDDCDAGTLSRLGRLEVLLADYPAARANFEKALAMRQAIGDRAGEAATFFQLGAVADRLGRTAAGSRLVALCCMIDKAIGHRDSDSDLRAVASFCTKAGLDESQVEKLLAEVAEAYKRDRGISLIERAFSGAADDAASGPPTEAEQPQPPPRGPGLLRRLWGAIRRGGEVRGG